MARPEEFVAAIVQAGDGEIIGRIRLQKIVYLLEQLGMGAGFSFTYHHYGPYSEDVATAIDFAQFLDGSIEEKVVPTQVGSYSIFKLAKAQQVEPARLGDLAWTAGRDAISIMKAETSVVIELAATIHWLKHQEKIADWRTELVMRKAGKASADRMTRAVTLLGRLNLAA